VLKCIENDDKEICSVFWPDMEDVTTSKGKEVAELRKVYSAMRTKIGAYELYNLLEKVIIEVELLPDDKKTMDEYNLDAVLLKHVRGMAM